MHITHPYHSHEATPLWQIIENALQQLMDNQDIEITTPKEYVIGFLCSAILKGHDDPSDLGSFDAKKPH